MSSPLWLFPPSRGETSVHVQMADGRISGTGFLENRFGSHPLTYLPQFRADTVHEFQRREPARTFDLCSSPTHPPPERPHPRTRYSVHRPPDPASPPCFDSFTQVPTIRLRSVVA